MILLNIRETIYRDGHENVGGGGVKISITWTILESSTAFESSRRVTCHVTRR